MMVVKFGKWDNTASVWQQTLYTSLTSAKHTSKSDTDQQNIAKQWKTDISQQNIVLFHFLYGSLWSWTLKVGHIRSDTVTDRTRNGKGDLRIYSASFGFKKKLTAAVEPICNTFVRKSKTISAQVSFGRVCAKTFCFFLSNCDFWVTRASIKRMSQLIKQVEKEG